MVVFLGRSSWTSTPRPTGMAAFAPPVRGVAVHWTGSSTPLGQTATLEQTAARLERERVDHTQGRGWSDIAYNYAIDEAGRCFELRGRDLWSAANGNPTVNARWGAVTFLIGRGDQPTDAAVEAFRAWRSQVWLPRWPDATGVIGHRDLYATECPGPALYQLVRGGVLTAQTGGPGQMGQWTLDDIAKACGHAAADATMSAQADYKVHDPTPDDPKHLIDVVTALGETLRIARGLAADMAEVKAELAELRQAVSR